MEGIAYMRQLTCQLLTVHVWGTLLGVEFLVAQDSASLVGLVEQAFICKVVTVYVRESVFPAPLDQSPRMIWKRTQGHAAGRLR